MTSRRLAATALALPLLLAACGSADSGGDAATGDTAAGAVAVTASFYPLQWIAERVGGEFVEVTNLTAPGAEPHDLELTPRDVGALGDADLVVYLAGFQPAVDDAVETAGVASFDVSEEANLDLEAGEHGHDHEGDDHEGDDHADEEHATGVDPHFWLDPLRLADVADAFAARLADVAPDEADQIRANAEELRADLEALDAELADGLASCERRELVTAHEAFGYLAERYDLEQLGIAGLSPTQEPSPADLAEVSEFVEEHGVQTIYFETLTSPAVAETIAAETGAATAVLDPIEGLTEESAGDDYLSIMRANLASIREGQPCT